MTAALNRMVMRAIPFAVIVFVAYPVNAQVGATTGAIIGTVADNTKAVVPGVTVTASGPAMMGTRTVVTDAEGAYRIPAIPPGVYSLVFELPGFQTITHEGIQVGLGFTATINVELSPAAVAENITVSGASPVVDLTSTKVSTNYGAEQLANLTGSRDYAAITSYLPGVIMSRPSVGGSGAVTYQRSTRYGLVGHDRGEVEGIVTTEAAAGGQEVAYSDSDSFEDMALNVVGNGADMPNPGTLTKVISKSGSNTYRGRVYLDYQDDAWEAHNIDASQIALGLTAPGTVGLTDGNRLLKFRDLSADLGGFVFKNKLWWYGAYRKQYLEQYELNLLDDTHILTLEVLTTKIDYSPRQNHKLTWYRFYGVKRQNNSILANLSNTTIVTKDALQTQKWPNGVWKFEYNGVLGTAAVFEVRAGNFFERGIYDGRGASTRYTDTGTNRAFGTANWSRSEHHRPQASGALTYFKDGWGGTHNFKVGGELMNERSWGSGGVFNNIELVLNNGVPTQVRLYDPPVESGKRGIWAWAGYVQDTWKLNSRLTFNLGVRLDQLRSYVPAQTGPTGQKFDRLDAPVWSNAAPRLGVVYALAADGRTLLKANYGQYWTFPYTDIANLMNPVPSQSSRLYTWTPANPRFENGFPVYDRGQEGLLLSVTGARPDGRPATTLDPNIQNEYSRQALVYVEREVAPNWGVRTGFVWNALRQGRETINASQPFDAFNVPVTVTDPGPDGRVGTGDDGGAIQAFNLNPAYLGRPPDQVHTNIPYKELDAYTWEVQTSRRQTGHWSLQASFIETWQSLGALRSAPYLNASPVTPNALINTVDGRHEFAMWAAKLNMTVDLWGGIRVTPGYRYQSGPPFARTFIARLNYNSSVLINSEPVGTRRMPASNLIDVRAEKASKIWRGTVGLFFDVYNLFNSNATQEVNRASGRTFLRPSVITVPRIARIGLKFSF